MLSKSNGGNGSNWRFCYPAWIERWEVEGGRVSVRSSVGGLLPRAQGRQVRARTRMAHGRGPLS